MGTGARGTHHAGKRLDRKRRGWAVRTRAAVRRPALLARVGSWRARRRFAEASQEADTERAGVRAPSRSRGGETSSRVEQVGDHQWGDPSATNHKCKCALFYPSAAESTQCSDGCPMQSSCPKSMHTTEPRPTSSNAFAKDAASFVAILQPL